MASSGSDEHTTSQEALDGTVASPSHIEVPSTLQSRPRPSGLSEDVTKDSESDERHSDIEAASERQSDDGEEDENKAEGDNQKDRNKADSANKEGSSEVEKRQEDKNGAENGIQHDEIKAYGRNQGTQNDAEAVSQQGVQTAKTNVAEIPEFIMSIGSGDRIPHNQMYDLLFSQSYLENFELDEVNFRIKAIESHRLATRWMHYCQPSIVDVQVLKDTHGYSSNHFGITRK
jgi:hypothetical protein